MKIWHKINLKTSSLETDECHKEIQMILQPISTNNNSFLLYAGISFASHNNSDESRPFREADSK